MDDLISRDALLAAYDAAHKGPPGGARKLIEEAPAVDAEPIIRCKHCAHCVPLQDGKSFYCRSSEMEFYAPYYDMATYFCGDREEITNAGATAGYRRTEVSYGETAQMQGLPVQSAPGI